MAEIFAAIDVATVAGLVATLGVAVIGINMAFKAIGLGKRAVRSI